MWTERQHALLKAMGVRLWSPPLPPVPPVPHLPHLPPASGSGPAAAEPATAALAPAPSPALADTPAGALAQPVLSAAAPSASPAPSASASAPPLPAAPRLPVPIPGALTEAQVMLPTASLAGLDWPALRAAVADCRACGLCDGRRQTVFGAGHPQARWLVVGEAPGEQEDLAGEPFVGPAGQLLDAMLQALQLSRRADDDLAAWPAERRVYIANTLKCRPPRNRNPEPAELAQCAPYLARQVELLRPRVILALGRFAVQALLGSSEAIGRLRGRVHQYQGTPLIVSYHPAYLLRNPADKARAWEDLCLAAAAAQGAAADPELATERA